jgi:hypothetical protein
MAGCADLPVLLLTKAGVDCCRHGPAGKQELLTEGRAKIIKQGNDVFYNEAQVRCTRCVYSVLLLLLFQQQAPVGFVALCFSHHAFDFHQVLTT